MVIARPSSRRASLARGLLLPIAALAALAAAPSALACQPEYYPQEPTPAQKPGESDAQYKLTLKAHADKLAEQQRLRFEAKRLGQTKQEGERWETSESVILAQVVKLSEMPLRDGLGHEIGTSPKVMMKPVTWLKGKGRKRNFAVHFTGSTSCGYHGGGDAVYGKVGDRFVVFVTRGAPSMTSITEAIGTSRALDPRTKAALAMQDLP